MFALVREITLFISVTPIAMRSVVIIPFHQEAIVIFPRFLHRLVPHSFPLIMFVTIFGFLFVKAYVLYFCFFFISLCRVAV